MRITPLYESWSSEHVIRAELVEGGSDGPKICVTVTREGATILETDAVGRLDLDEMLAVPVNESFVAQVTTHSGRTDDVILPYRVVDKALSHLGYEVL